MPKVSIITTTYRSYSKLNNCINSVLSKTKDVDFDWHIWANDPDEKMIEILNSKKIKSFLNSTNDGSFSSNNNGCVKLTDSEFILLLNDDMTVINEDWLKNMLIPMEEKSNIGVVGSFLLYPNNTIQHCGVFFSEKTNRLPFHMLYKQPINEFAKKSRYYQAVTGACLLIRRKDFDLVDGLNESYIYGFEDIDLCLKIKKQLNKSSLYCANSKLYHHEGISGTFKKHPNLQNNIKIFKDNWDKKISMDYDYYLKDSNFGIY